MSKLEQFRELLYKAIDAGNFADILKISQELDKLILMQMKNQEHSQKISA